MLAYIIFNIASAFFSLPAGILADKVGAKKVLFFGYLLFSYVYLMFGLAEGSGIVWFLFPAYGLYLALTEGVGKAYISRLVPHEIAASAFGVYQVFVGMATFTASFLAGLMWTNISPSAPFVFGSVLAFISAGLFYLFSRWIRVHPEATPIQIKK
jgi:MFS family permease